jgi:FK506-binding nuclear protein
MDLSGKCRRLAPRAAGLALLGLGLAACGEEHEMHIEETRVKIVEETIGNGKPARDGAVVCIDFRVRLPDGEEVLWGSDFCFKVGAGAVIAGFDEALPGMRVGGRRVVSCPPHKHWGREGYGGTVIPERTTLTLDVQLRSIE